MDYRTAYCQSLTRAGILGEALVEVQNIDDRAIVFASVLRVLAISIQDGDAYGPIMNLAGEIEHQATLNIEAVNETN